VPIDAVDSDTPIFNQSSIKNDKIRRRQTIDTVQAQEYSSHRQHQTPLQQLQAIFWPTRQTHTNNQLSEHEQSPMITEKQTPNVQRSSSAHKNNQNIINDNLNQRKNQHST
jgi:hypothetical protein